MDPKEKKIRDRFASERLDPATVERDVLDAVPFRFKGRGLDITTIYEEFTHICPMTGLPDIGTLTIEYQPDESIVELKSLKYYLLQYRQVGTFYEHVVFHVLDDLVETIRPKWMRIHYDVTPRGGIRSEIDVEWPEPN
ncbi:MAG: preQ(1) synthase [Pseudomonadota bacterium]